jgi:small neutral amino acid transporter SnatA (MarC family)
LTRRHSPTSGRKAVPPLAWWLSAACVAAKNIIVVVATATALSFLLAGRLARILGRTGNIVIAPLLGILLAAFAAQFVVDGVKGAFDWLEWT